MLKIVPSWSVFTLLDTTRELPSSDLRSTKPGNCILGDNILWLLFFLWAHLLSSHRHVRFGLFFHSLALIQCLWSDSIPKDQRSRYLHQVQLNQEYLRRWISPSPVNNSTWHALIVSRQDLLVRRTPTNFNRKRSLLRIKANRMPSNFMILLLSMYHPGMSALC